MDAEFLIIDQIEDVAIIKLNQGITNPINTRLVLELSIIFENLSGDDNLNAIVLTSANDKFFSIGLDIPTLIELSENDFRIFYRSFNQLCFDLFRVSKPVIAAITGHAIAGACILALCCDYRYIADGRKLMGLNEIKLGLSVPFVADCILRNLIGNRLARDVMDSGELFEPPAAFKMGIVDKISPVDEVLDSALSKAKDIAASSLVAFSLIKKNRITPVSEEIMAHLNDREESFIQCWFSSETQDRLKEAISKF